MNIEQLFQPGCNNFTEKLCFFSLAENWHTIENLDASQHQFLKASLDLIRKKYNKGYFSTLFHLLTCPFCIAQAPSILEPKSHPRLWELLSRHPGYFIDILQQTKTSSDESLKYFLLLYENLIEVEKAGILFYFKKHQQIHKQIFFRAKAAGAAEKLPPVVSVPQDLFTNTELHFSQSHIDSSLGIRLIAPGKIRKSVQLVIFYYNHPQDVFYSKTIIVGGNWKISHQKAQDICRIDLIYKDEEMRFRIGFPVDTGECESSFLVVLRLILARLHMCKNGGVSGLRHKSGAEYVFERAPQHITDRCRYQFEIQPEAKQQIQITPENLCGVGYSDAAACALAIAQYETYCDYEENWPVVMISCSFTPRDKNQGFAGFLIDRVTSHDSRECGESLFNKWQAVSNNNALALVLHKQDADILTRKIGQESVSLSKNTFSQLSDGILPSPAIISCESNQLSLLANSLKLNSSLFENLNLNPDSEEDLFGYRVIEKLGEGGMGTVYKVENKELKRIESLKFLKLENEEMHTNVKRFRLEAQALASLKRECRDLHIPEVYEFQNKAGYFYYTMEYISGQSLEVLIEQKQVTLSQAIKVTIDLAKILQITHEKDIVHRDIKPANVIIDKKGETWLVDFGIIQMNNNDVGTEPGVCLGTPLYIAPEQLKGESCLQSDIYSLGAVLYEMLTSSTVVSADSMQALVYQILYGAVKPPSQIKDVDSSLDVICLKALHKDLNKRYQNMKSFQQDLESYPGLELEPELVSQNHPFNKASILFGVILLVIIGLLFPPEPTSSNSIKTYTMGTSESLEGGYHSIGQFFRDEVKNLSKGSTKFILEAESSGGSVANIEGLLNNEFDFALVQEDVLYHAIHNPEKPLVRDKLRYIVAIHYEKLAIVVNGNKKITNLQDLNGKRVNLGNEGSGTLFIARKILDVHKIKLKTGKLAKPADAVNMFTNEGTIDAFFYMVGHPKTEITKVSRNMDIYLIPITGMDSLLTKSPYYHETIIPAEDYPSIKNSQDIPTIGVRAVLVTTKDVPDEVVETMTKIFFEKQNSFKNRITTSPLKEISSKIDGLPGKMHPGAEKYYQSKGH